MPKEAGFSEFRGTCVVGRNAAVLADIVQGADVAQLVEQLIRNQQVVGSNPTISSIPFTTLTI